MSGTCAAGSAISSINQAGTVGCQSATISGTFHINVASGFGTHSLFTIPDLGTVTGGAPDNNHVCAVQFTNTSSDTETVTGTDELSGSVAAEDFSVAPGATVNLLNAGTTAPKDGWADVAVVDAPAGTAAQLSAGFSIPASSDCTSNAAALG